ncbi:MAG: hypothetical protein ACLUJM_10835, partial [Finegoldia sp.]|uniref:hypothetical protein n=1 Tax=Finegoldia sp. TaxID=1981334 RepID=UPI0039965364
KFNDFNRSASLQKSSFRKSNEDFLVRSFAHENIKFSMVIFLASIVCSKISLGWGLQDMDKK